MGLFYCIKFCYLHVNLAYRRQTTMKNHGEDFMQKLLENIKILMKRGQKSRRLNLNRDISIYRQDCMPMFGRKNVWPRTSTAFL